MVTKVIGEISPFLDLRGLRKLAPGPYNEMKLHVHPLYTAVHHVATADVIHDMVFLLVTPCMCP